MKTRSLVLALTCALICLRALPASAQGQHSTPPAVAQAPTDKDLIKAVAEFVESTMPGNVAPNTLVIRAVTGKHTEKDKPEFVAWFFDRTELAKTPDQRYWMETFIGPRLTSLASATLWGKKLAPDEVLGPTDLSVSGYTSFTFMRSWSISETQAPGSVAIPLKSGTTTKTVYAAELH